MKKVKFAYDPSNGLYMFEFYSLKNYTSEEVFINGIKVENPFNSKHGIIKDKPEKVEILLTATTLIGYQKDGEVMDITSWQKTLSDLSAKGEWDDDLDEYVFDNIEDEVNYLRFTREWKKEYTSGPVKNECEIEIIEHPVSDIRYIVPSFSMGSASIFDTICSYEASKEELFSERCKFHGLEKASNENEKGKVFFLGSSRMRYAKINGNYCVGDERDRMTRTSGRGSYEDMKKIHERNLQIIDEIILESLSKMNPNKIEEPTLGKVISDLITIYNRVLDLDVKSKSSSSQRGVLKQIEDLKKELIGSSLDSGSK